MVLVDSDVWSLALRRPQPAPGPYIERLSMLIEQGEVALIGLVRQEVLSGIRAQKQFEKVRKQMRAFPDQAVGPGMHELAASFFNHCRGNGVQGSHADFLICACAVSWKMRILSTDRDYRHYASCLPIDLEIL
ncbi:MAG: PIN domain-containing protein [Verrucomicrobiota bacterium]